MTVLHQKQKTDVHARRFADTRKNFSQEAAGGGMTEALVDVRNCDFSNLNLSGKVQCVTSIPIAVLLASAFLGLFKQVSANNHHKEMDLSSYDWRDTELRAADHYCWTSGRPPKACHSVYPEIPPTFC